MSTQLLHQTAPPRHHSDHAKREAHRVGALAHHHPRWCVTQVVPVNPFLVRQGGFGWLDRTRAQKTETDPSRMVAEHSSCSGFWTMRSSSSERRSDQLQHPWGSVEGRIEQQWVEEQTMLPAESSVCCTEREIGGRILPHRRSHGG